MRRKIAIIAGGDSSEYEVSLRSAAGIYSFLSGIASQESNFGIGNRESGVQLFNRGCRRSGDNRCTPRMFVPA